MSALVCLLLAAAGAARAPFFQQTRSAVWTGWVRIVARMSDIPAYPPEDMSSRLDTLVAENIRLNAELTDYQIIRSQLAAPTFADFATVPAYVIGRPIDSLRSQIIVNRGRRDGVTTDQPVLINGSTLIGFITSVEERTAVCTLLLHPASAVAAETRVDEADVVQGAVVGAHYTALRLTTIPRDKKLQEKRDVVTITKANTIPHGLLIGYIDDIHNEETEVYQNAYLSLPYDPDQLRAVTILAPRT